MLNATTGIVNVLSNILNSLADVINATTDIPYAGLTDFTAISKPASGTIAFHAGGDPIVFSAPQTLIFR